MQTMILSHYPAVIKRIREMRQMAEAEDIEFSRLNASINEAIENMFVSTAGEAGVRRFEELLGIRPKAGQGLDERKVYILSMMNRRRMSLPEIKAALSDYCGDVELICDIAEMEMSVAMEAGTVGITAVNGILDELMPLNIHLRYVTRMRGRESVKFLGMQRAAAKLLVRPLPQECAAPAAAQGIRAAAFMGAALRAKPSDDAEMQA